MTPNASIVQPKFPAFRENFECHGLSFCVVCRLQFTNPCQKIIVYSILWHLLLTRQMHARQTCSLLFICCFVSNCSYSNQHHMPPGNIHIFIIDNKLELSPIPAINCFVIVFGVMFCQLVAFFLLLALSLCLSSPTPSHHSHSLPLLLFAFLSFRVLRVDNLAHTNPQWWDAFLLAISICVIKCIECYQLSLWANLWNAIWWYSHITTINGGGCHHKRIELFYIFGLYSSIMRKYVSVLLLSVFLYCHCRDACFNSKSASQHSKYDTNTNIFRFHSMQTHPGARKKTHSQITSTMTKCDTHSGPTSYKLVQKKIYMKDDGLVRCSVCHESFQTTAMKLSYAQYLIWVFLSLSFANLLYSLPSVLFSQQFPTEYNNNQR